jgi:hypothetical protein
MVVRRRGGKQTSRDVRLARFRTKLAVPGRSAGDPTAPLGGRANSPVRARVLYLAGPHGVGVGICPRVRHASRQASWASPLSSYSRRATLPTPSASQSVKSSRDLDPCMKFRFVDYEVVPARTTGGALYMDGGKLSSYGRTVRAASSQRHTGAPSHKCTPPSQRLIPLARTWSSFPS